MALLLREYVVPVRIYTVKYSNDPDPKDSTALQLTVIAIDARQALEKFDECVPPGSVAITSIVYDRMVDIQ